MRIHRLAAIGLLLVVFVGCTKEQRICRRMGELCSVEAGQCQEAVRDLKHAGGDAALAKLDRCYADAKTCAEAKGCEARVTLESAASAVGDFFESLSGGGGEREKRKR
jgi:hypothetical protein